MAKTKKVTLTFTELFDDGRPSEEILTFDTTTILGADRKYRRATRQFWEGSPKVFGDYRAMFAEDHTYELRITDYDEKYIPAVAVKTVGFHGVARNSVWNPHSYDMVATYMDVLSNGGDNDKLAEALRRECGLEPVLTITGEQLERLTLTEEDMW